MKGNKRTLLVLLGIAALLCVALFGLLQLLDVLLARNTDPNLTESAAVGIAATGAVSETDPQNLHTVVFPAYTEGRSDANAAAYDTMPFLVTLALPEGWMPVLPAVEQRTGDAPYTPVQLVDAAGTLCGELGFEPAGAVSAEVPVLLEYPRAVVHVPELSLSLLLNMDPAAATEAGLAAIAESIAAAPVA